MLRHISTCSTYEQLHLVHDYNAHPFAKLGTTIEVHAKPGKRKTWDTRKKPEFYLGPTLEHYRCHVVWVQETTSKRIWQTVFFNSKHITQPYLTMSDALILTGENIVQCIEWWSALHQDTRVSSQATTGSIQKECSERANQCRRSKGELCGCPSSKGGRQGKKRHQSIDKEGLECSILPYHAKKWPPLEHSSHKNNQITRHHAMHVPHGQGRVINCAVHRSKEICTYLWKIFY